MSDDVFVLPHPPRICDECVRTKPLLHNPTMTAYLHCPHNRSVAAFSIPLQRWELWAPIDDEAFIDGLMEATRLWHEAIRRHAN